MQHVHQQVRGDEQRGVKHDRAHHHRVVAVERRGDEVLTGGGIYLTQAGTRGVDVGDGMVEDRWLLNLDLDGPARVVLYNSGALQDPSFAVLHNGEPIGAAEGVRFVDEGDAVTVVTLPAPARGAWTITRRGKKP